MADNSAIEWTDATWNPIVGCSIVSPGCTNCYAMRMADRLSAMAPKPDGTGNPHLLHYVKTITRDPTKRGYDWSAPVWTGHVAQAPDQILLQPLRWRKPKRIFVNSMGDLFHESVPDEWIDKVFAVMAQCPQHTFQVLTKRAERMRAYFANEDRKYQIELVMADIGGDYDARTIPNADWPLPNVWLGVSAERQQEADERIPHLLQTPAAIRFVSAEPLLGPLDLFNGDPDPRLGGHKAMHTFLGDWWEPGDDPKGPSRHGLDWVIAGGESGPHARAAHPDWFRSLRDQCDVADVPFFFKQWGEYHPSDQHDDKGCKQETPDAIHVDGRREYRPFEQFKLIGGRVPGWAGMCRVGKKSAGRLLDGKEHNAFPGAQ